MRVLDLIANFTINTTAFYSDTRQVEVYAAKATSSIVRMQDNASNTAKQIAELKKELSSLNDIKTNFAPGLAQYEKVKQEVAKNELLRLDKLEQRYKDFESGTNAAISRHRDKITDLGNQKFPDIGPQVKAYTDKLMDGVVAFEKAEFEKIAIKDRTSRQLIAQIQSEISAEKAALEDRKKIAAETARLNKEAADKNKDGLLREEVRRKRALRPEREVLKAERDADIQAIRNSDKTDAQKIELEGKRNARYETASRHLDQRVDAKGRSLADVQREIKAADKEVERLNKAYEAALEDLRKAVGASNDTVNKRKATRLKKLEEIVNGINDEIDNLQDTVNKKTNEVLTKAGEERKRLLSEANKFYSKKNDEIHGHLDEIDRLNKKIADASDVLKKEKANLGDNIQKKLDEYIEALKAKIDSIEKQIDKKTKDLGHQEAAIFDAKRVVHARAQKDVGRTLANIGEASDYATRSTFQLAGETVRNTAGLVKEGADTDFAILHELQNTSLNPSEIKQARLEIIALGNQSGKSFADVAKGFRLAENFGYKFTDALNIVKESLKSSVGYNAELADVVNVTAKSMAAFGGKANDARGYVVGLTKAAAISSLEMDEMAKVGGHVFGILGGVGIKFNEAAAAMVYFTRKGLDGRESAIQLRNVVNKIFDPTKEVLKELDVISSKSGINLVKAFSIEGLQKNGIVGTFELLQRAGEKLGIPFEVLATRIFPNLRATLGGLFLNSKTGLKDMRGLLDEITKAVELQDGTVGELEDKYKNAIGSSGGQIRILTNEVESLKIHLAEALLPTIKEVVRWTGNLATWVSNLTDADKEWYVQTGKNVLIWSVLSAGILRAVVNTGLFVNAIRTVGPGLIGISQVVKSLAEGGTIAALGTAAVGAGQKFTGFGSAIAMAGGGVRGFLSVLAGGTRLLALGGPYVVGFAAITAAIIGGINVYNKFNKTQEDKIRLTKEEARENEILLQTQVRKQEGLVKHIEVVETLSAVTKRTKDEQQELNSHLNQISIMRPDLISAYDETGNAISLMGEKASEAKRQLAALNQQQQEAKKLQLNSEIKLKTLGIEDYRSKIAEDERLLLPLQRQADPYRSTNSVPNALQTQIQSRLDSIAKSKSMIAKLQRERAELESQVAKEFVGDPIRKIFGSKALVGNTIMGHEENGKLVGLDGKPLGNLAGSQAIRLETEKYERNRDYARSLLTGEVSRLRTLSSRYAAAVDPKNEQAKIDAEREVETSPFNRLAREGSFKENIADQEKEFLGAYQQIKIRNNTLAKMVEEAEAGAKDAKKLKDNEERGWELYRQILAATDQNAGESKVSYKDQVKKFIANSDAEDRPVSRVLREALNQVGVKADAFRVKQTLDAQRLSLEELRLSLEPKDGETVEEKILLFFKKNTLVANEIGEEGQRRFIAQTKYAIGLAEAQKKTKEIFKEIGEAEKALLRELRPADDVDRLASEFFGVQELYDVFQKFPYEDALQIVEVIERLSKAKRQTAFNKTMSDFAEDLDKAQKALATDTRPADNVDRLSKEFFNLNRLSDAFVKFPLFQALQVVDVIGKLSASRREDIFGKLQDKLIEADRRVRTKLYQPGSYAEYLYREFQIAEDDPRISSKAKVLLDKAFATEVIEKKISGLLDRIRAVSFKQGLSKSGDSLIDSVFATDDAIKRFDNRLERVKRSFVDTFSGAFTSVLTKSGSFVNSLVSSVKSGLVKLASEQLAGELFKVISKPGGFFGKIFGKRPEFNKDQKTLLEDPELYFRRIYETFFSKGGVLNVRLVGSADQDTNTHDEKRATGVPTTSEGKSKEEQAVDNASRAYDKANQFKNGSPSTKVALASEAAKAAKLHPSVAKGLGVASGVLLINELLDDPIGDVFKGVRKFLKKPFSRGVGGIGTAGEAYQVHDTSKMEIFVPNQNGRFIADVSALNTQPHVTVNQNAPVTINNGSDLDTLGKEIAIRVLLAR